MDNKQNHFIDNAALGSQSSNSLDDISSLSSNLFNEYLMLIEEGKRISQLSKAKIAQIQRRKEQFSQYEIDTKALMTNDSNKSTVISFNVSGIRHSIKGQLLIKYTKNLFFEIIASESFDYSKEIYLNRPSKPFGYILTFYRDDSLPLWELSTSDLKEILIECEYFQFNELKDYIKASLRQ